MIRERSTEKIEASAAVAALVAAALVAFTAPGFALSADELATVGEKIAVHRLTPLEGDPVAVNEMAGDVVVINFWATWCKPCQDELPVLDGLHRRLTERGGQVAAVSIDRDRRKVERFVSERGLRLPVYHDGPDGLVARLDLDHFPFTVVIDRNGRAVYTTHETSDDALAALEAKVMELAANPPVRVADGASR